MHCFIFFKEMCIIASYCDDCNKLQFILSEFPQILNFCIYMWPNYALFCVFKFCEFISVSWMAHLAGKVVQTLLDYVNHVHICSKLQSILEKQEEWPNICDSLSKLFTIHVFTNLYETQKITIF